jgi:hypothetical protein
MNETTNETRAGEVSRRYAVTFRFQAGHMPSWQESIECYPLSPVAAGSRWSLLLLSPLLSASGGCAGIRIRRSASARCPMRRAHVRCRLAGL